MTRWFWRALLLSVLLSMLLFWVACGGGSSTGGVSTKSANTGSTVQLTISDGPGDRVAAFSITVNSVTLTPSVGNAVSLVSAPLTVEMTQLAGTTMPLATITVPAGTYNQMTITLGGATISVVDPGTGQVTQKTLPAPPPVTLTLNPAFVATGSPLVLNLDMNLSSSVAIDAFGNISFNPRFLATHGPMGGPGGLPNPFTGGVEHMMGVVSGISGTTFTITTPMQRTMSFTTDTSTAFVNASGVGGLRAGMLVMVNGQTQSDGTVLATRVVAMNALTNSAGATGVVAKTTGSPVTQFQLITRSFVVGMSAVDSNGTPVPLAAQPMGLTVNVTSSTVFRYNTDGVDLTGVTLPTFSAATLLPGQLVEVDAAGGFTLSSGGMMMGMLPTLGTLNASQVEVEQHSMVGVVSDYNGGATFTLTVPSDAVFATLSQATTITVLKQPGTMLMNSLALSNGQTVMVRGLLYNDSGAWKLVATRVGQLPVAP